MGTLTKGLIGQEDIRYLSDSFFPKTTDTFTRTGSMGGTVTMTKLPNQLLNHTAIYNPLYHNNAVKNDTTISNALSAIASNSDGITKRTVYLEPGVWTISNSLTIPSTVTLWADHGAILAVGSGKTLTINGPVDFDLSQHFSGSGTVSYSVGSVAGVIPQWYGCVADGSTDDSTAFQKAVTDALASNLDMNLTGNYHFHTAINIDRAVDTTHKKFYLIGSPHAILSLDTEINLFTSTLVDASFPVSENIEFQNVTFRCSDAMKAASKNAYVLNGIKFLRIAFSHCTFDKIKLLKISSHILQTIYLSGCYLKYWEGYFINATVHTGTFDMSFTDNWIESGGTFYYSIPDTGYLNNGIRFVSNLIENLTGRVIESGSFRSLAITDNYFEYNANDNDHSAINLSAVSANYGVKIVGNYCLSDVTNRDNASYWEIDLGTTGGVISGGNWSNGRLYDNDGAYSLNPHGDIATTAVLKNAWDGSFVGELTGFDETVTITVYYTRNENAVLLYLPTAQATSDANSMSLVIVGTSDPCLPAQLWPTREQCIPFRVSNNGTTDWGLIVIGVGGSIYFARGGSGGGFDVTGEKGIYTTTASYSLV